MIKLKCLKDDAYRNLKEGDEFCHPALDGSIKDRIFFGEVEVIDDDVKPAKKKAPTKEAKEAKG